MKKKKTKEKKINILYKIEKKKKESEKKAVKNSKNLEKNLTHWVAVVFFYVRNFCYFENLNVKEGHLLTPIIERLDG